MEFLITAETVEGEKITSVVERTITERRTDPFTGKEYTMFSVKKEEKVELIGSFLWDGKEYVPIFNLYGLDFLVPELTKYYSEQLITSVKGLRVYVSSETGLFLAWASLKVMCPFLSTDDILQSVEHINVQDFKKKLELRYGTPEYDVPYVLVRDVASVLKELGYTELIGDTYV